MGVLSGYGLRSGIIGVIDEEEASRGQDDSSESGRHSSKGKLGGKGGLDTPSDDEESGSNSGDDSSIDGDLEQNEQQMYEEILAAQARGGSSSGPQIDDLIDRDMIDLMRVCSHFRCPTFEELQ